MMESEFTSEEFAAMKRAAGITPKIETMLKILGIMLKHEITLDELREFATGQDAKE